MYFVGKWKIALLSLIGIVVGAVVLVLLAIRPDCDNVIIKEILSPDGKMVATLFQRDCGATTSVASIVSLRKNGEKFKDKKSRWVFVYSGVNQVFLRWVGDVSLQIAYSGGDVFKKELSMDGVSIVCTEVANGFSEWK